MMSQSSRLTSAEDQALQPWNYLLQPRWNKKRRNLGTLKVYLDALEIIVSCYFLFVLFCIHNLKHLVIIMKHWLCFVPSAVDILLLDWSYCLPAKCVLNSILLQTTQIFLYICKLIFTIQLFILLDSKWGPRCKIQNYGLENRLGKFA